MTVRRITVGERVRSYEHFAPGQPRSDAPLLLALHGTNQNARSMRRFSGRTLDALADRIGADLVYLNGYHRAWNDARLTARSAAQKADIDDVGFVEAVIEAFGRPSIAVGYSNGGQLLHRVLRQRHGVLAGAAIIAAGLPVREDFALAESAPDVIPILLFHGTADPIAPYDGGPTRLFGRARGSVISALQTAESYAPDASPVTSESAAVKRTDWGRVHQVTQIGAGHVIPNLRSSPARLFVGPSLHDLDAGREIEEFFQLGRKSHGQN